MFSFISQERCEKLVEKNEMSAISHVAFGEAIFQNRAFLEKSLDAALDSLDNLFCRRCLVFLLCFEQPCTL
jgi:hypothetical protein